MCRYVHLSIYDEEHIDVVLASLSSKVRRDILRLLDQSSCSVAEIANQLEIPLSTAAFHVNNLQKADLINIQVKPAQHGVSKIISRKIDEINLCCVAPPNVVQVATKVLDVPIGSYSDCQVAKSCGLASEHNMIELDDTPGVFFSTEKSEAQIIWFNSGYLEYKIPNYFLKNSSPISLAISMELCSEAPNYRNDWESDITFWLNGEEVCTWTSPGDFGGQRGKLNPSWWPDISTQYGLLKTLRINEHGVHLDGQKMSNKKLEHLHIEEGDYFTLRVGVKPDANNVGGMNLFGEKFGNFQQNIMVRVEYKEKEEKRD